MPKSMKQGILALLAATGVIVASACWMACGSSSGGGDGGGPPPPAPPQLPTSSEGWTVLTPSADSLTIHVSDSDGDDADDGLTPATAKKTLSAGKAAVRSGFPDWLVLKAGDTWTDQDFGNWVKSGRNSLEPMVITSYGTGARPFIRTGTDNGLTMQTTAVSHVAVVGLRLQPHTYTGTEGATGIRLLTTCDDILFEDCYIESYKDNFVIQANNGPGTISNIRLRRCVVVDAYSATSSHSQGVFASEVNQLLIEECLFDHNGWNEGVAGAEATIFNHNTYISACTNVAVKGNLILRASSIGNKFRADAAAESHDLLVEDNFYLEGEIGISMGGNTAGALRFVDVIVRNNVMMHLGRTQPTGRTLSWYLDVQDWDGGLIEDNLFLHQPLAFDTYGINLAGQTERQISIHRNVFYGLEDKNVEIEVDNSETAISISENEFQDPLQGSVLVDQDGSFAAATYQGNSYFTTASNAAWFQVNGSNKSYAEWLTLSGETGSSTGAATYPDPARDETTYQASLGGTATLAAFIAEARLQSKAFWRPAYTAAAINDYIREGFGR